MVDVLFATNRVRSADPLSPFGSSDIAADNTLYCGVATVDSININVSSSGRITKVDQLVQGNFKPEHLAPILGSTNDILVFIHGAANDFSDSITRAAYNQSWLAASGLANSAFDVITFSWPATRYTLANIPGDYFDYLSDQNAANKSAAQFGMFLNQIAALRSEVDQLGTKRINLLCHSMGNLMLAAAVPTFLQMSNTNDVIFDEIVLAAADEISTTFSSANRGRLARLRANRPRNNDLFRSRRCRDGAQPHRQPELPAGLQWPSQRGRYRILLIGDLRVRRLHGCERLHQFGHRSQPSILPTVADREKGHSGELCRLHAHAAKI